MVNISSQNNKMNVTVTSGSSGSNINIKPSVSQTDISASPDTAMYYSEKSREWAIGNRIVDNEDYSSKYYANQAKQSSVDTSVYMQETKSLYDNFPSIVDNAIEDLGITKNEVVEQIETTKNEALVEVESIKSQAVATVKDASTNAISNLNKEIEEGKQEIKDSVGDLKVLTTLDIGDIGFTQMAIDETKGKRRVLNGQVIIQEQYVQFTNIIKESVALNPDLACTEAEWQTAVTMSTNGVCEKFVIDDEAGIIRLPKYPTYLDLTNNTSSVASKTQTVSVYGNGKSLGMYDGSRNFGLSASGNAQYANTGGYNKTVGTAVSGTHVTDSKAWGVVKDSTTSGLTGSVTIPAIAGVTSEKIKGTYFIQVATGAETEDNITNEIELNNPFFYGMSQYFKMTPNNISWLKSEGQYNAKAVYTAYYEWLLKIYNGVETVEGINVLTVNEEYTDYDFVLNLTDETFRLPLKNGQEGMFGGSVTVTNSAVSVYGNDKQLGLTTSGTSTNIGLGWNGAYACYGPYKSGNLPQDIASVTTGSMDAVGVTTNASQSGLTGSVTSTAKYTASTTAPAGWSLYYYIGETVQNANLVNIGRIQETMATKSMVDGAWVNKYLAICSSVTISDSNVNYDLSDYLPNDGYNYEVIFAGNVTTTSTSGAYVNLYIKSSVITTNVGICGTRTRTTSAMTAVGSAMIPIGTNRVVTVGGLGTAGGGTYALNAVGYRRIGTNI